MGKCTRRSSASDVTSVGIAANNVHEEANHKKEHPMPNKGAILHQVAHPIHQEGGLQQDQGPQEVLTKWREEVNQWHQQSQLGAVLGKGIMTVSRLLEWSAPCVRPNR